MTRMTLKTLTLALALFALAGCGKSGFTDNRDGKVYATTKIGKQIWMAENLNYAADDSYCYQDDPANCAKYGRLYIWAAAMKACPTGWHLPTSKEWDELAEALGENAGTKLKSKEWDGTDTLGFNALSAGRRFYDGDFVSVGFSADFWTATESRGSNAYDRFLISDDTGLHELDYRKDCAFSVRCVKD